VNALRLPAPEYRPTLVSQGRPVRRHLDMPIEIQRPSMEEIQDGFEQTTRWVLAAASAPDAKGTTDEPGIGVLSQESLVTFAACLDDIKGHLLNGYTKLSDLFMEGPNSFAGASSCSVRPVAVAQASTAS
jgi:hypothetical protein